MFPVPAIRLKPWVDATRGFTVLPRVMVPNPATDWVEKLTVLLSTTAVPKLSPVFVVVMFDPIELLPAPFCRNAPVLVMALVAFFVNSPLLVMVVVPPTLKASFTFRIVPVKAKLFV